MPLEEHCEDTPDNNQSEAFFSYGPIGHDAVTIISNVSAYMLRIAQTYNQRFDHWYEKQRLRSYWKSRHSHKTK